MLRYNFNIMPTDMEKFEIEMNKLILTKVAKPN